MASKRFEVDIALNASGVAKGANDGEKALNNLEDALEDAGTGGAKDLNKIEDSLRDVQRQSEKTGRSINDVGDVGGRGLGKVKAGAQELQQEIGANLGEAVSSIRGDMSDLGQVGQDTLGGLAATLASTGPAGIAGAIGLAAGAVGWGLIMGSLTDQTKQAEKLRERLTSAYEDAASSGATYLDTAAVLANAQNLIFNPERADEWAKVQETQKETGLDLNTLIKANTGDLDALAVVQARVNDLNREASERGDEVNITQALTGDNLQQLKRFWDDTGTAAESSSAKSKASIEFTNQYLRDQIDAASAATKEVDELGNELYTLPTGEKILIEADTGTATQDVSRFKGDLNGVADTVVRPVIRPRVDSSEWDRWTPQLKTGRVAATLDRPGMSWE